ncbi:hypothetical protein GGX14DRAFT_396832 [Mycena pura]|uniref:Uncharacterized protein n=1 Tax=Mycena pura TaxID=153505 RepID=A0AAD6YFD1_9AGAR|nr:hypothetical protein GGX14DRAFT_396832 [Mycena pura]
MHQPKKLWFRAGVGGINRKRFLHGHGGSQFKWNTIGYGENLRGRIFGLSYAQPMPKTGDHRPPNEAITGTPLDVIASVVDVMAAKCGRRVHFINMRESWGEAAADSNICKQHSHICDQSRILKDSAVRQPSPAQLQVSKQASARPGKLPANGTEVPAWRFDTALANSGSTGKAGINGHVGLYGLGLGLLPRHWPDQAGGRGPRRAGRPRAPKTPGPTRPSTAWG